MSSANYQQNLNKYLHVDSASLDDQIKLISGYDSYLILIGQLLHIFSREMFPIREKMLGFFLADAGSKLDQYCFCMMF